jgi:hypothetical protein
MREFNPELPLQNIEHGFDNILEYVYWLGWMEGWVKGWVEGWMKGGEQGLERSRERGQALALTELAKNLLQKGWSRETLKEMLEVSDEWLNAREEFFKMN